MLSTLVKTHTLRKSYPWTHPERCGLLQSRLWQEMNLRVVSALKPTMACGPRLAFCMLISGEARRASYLISGQNLEGDNRVDYHRNRWQRSRVSTAESQIGYAIRVLIH